MPHTEFKLRLPEWLTVYLNEQLPPLTTDQQKMTFVIELSRRNIANGNGPFAAAVFESTTDSLISVGVNLVLATNCSVMHAEIVAIIMAQQAIKNFSLEPQDGHRYELFSTTEPCAMCMGAIPWSGISRLLCGARDEDAREIGFDEGNKPHDWVEDFHKRKITVVRDLCRDAAKQVLQDYGQHQGTIY
jgi:tRNA(Arg) A34 adenosine deaminase TadA